MIQRKKKYCKGCDSEQYLFSGGLCITCYKTKNKQKFQLKNEKPIKKVSYKQKEILKKYSTLRKEYLFLHGRCAVQLPDCTLIATEVHHSAKKYSEKLWLDTSLWIPICRSCHQKIEVSPELAKQLNIYNYKI